MKIFSLKSRSVRAAACLCLVWSLTTAARAQKPSLVVQTGHTARVAVAAFSPDGRLLASAGDDRTVKVWDVATGKELRTLAGYTESVSALTFSHDGRTLISEGLYVEGVRFWDVTTGEEIISLFAESVDFSRDHRLCAVGEGDGTVDLRTMADGELVREIAGHTAAVTYVRFSPDGRLLVSSDESNALKFWDVATGRELRSTPPQERFPSPTFSPDTKVYASIVGDALKLSGTDGGRVWLEVPDVKHFRFSPDGALLAARAADATRVFEVETGRQLYALSDGNDGFVFGPDGRRLVTSGLALKPTRVYDARTGRELHALPAHEGGTRYAVFSPDGKALVTAGGNVARVWDAETWRERRTFPAADGEMGFGVLGFSPDNKTVALRAADSNVIVLADLAGGEPRLLKGFAGRMTDAAYSPDGRLLAGGTWDGKVKIWDLTTGQELRSIDAGGQIYSVAFSPDARTIAVGSRRLAAKLGVAPDLTFDFFEVDGGTKLYSVRNALFGRLSPDGKTFAYVGPAPGAGDRPGEKDYKVVRVADAATGRVLRTLEGHTSIVLTFDFTPDGRQIVSGGMDKTIRFWDVATGRELRSINEGVGSGISLDVTPDGKEVVVVSEVPDDEGKTLATAPSVLSYELRVWDAATAQSRLIRAGFPNFSAVNVTVSPDGRHLAMRSWSETKVFKLATGELLYEMFPRADIAFVPTTFSPDGRHIAVANMDSVTFHNADTGREIGSLIPLAEREWAVVTPEGQFDGSPEGLRMMHFVVGTEPIELAQLKERYYEPNLLPKLMGFNPEPLRDVSALGEVKLYPSVEFAPPAPGQKKLSIKLRNRGGGIGQVQVFVNGKEVVADARPKGFNPNASEAVVTADLSGASVVAGSANEIKVVARNAEGYLASRDIGADWVTEEAADQTPPELYAIVAGVSDYAGERLDLRYAAKDAEDFAAAVELGAKKLFGADGVHLTLLTTGADPRAVSPTKANFRKAFEEAARKAKPTDVLLVYLAGHGFSLARGSDTYVYLTRDAGTVSGETLASDADLLRQVGVSSEELTEWTKAVPALKQVMVLDTCAAGAAAARLTEKRDLSGDQIRAIERLKDRTGFHVLMGSAADAVSYEASQYGQGVLTYALLQGMRGAALRDDSFVDVQKLFQYAADQVPQLARNIGGVQRPVVAAPRGTSFDVGRLDPEDRSRVPVSMFKPLVLRPRLLNPDEGDDTLDLIRALGARLREESYVAARGEQAPLVYVDAEELPGAVRPSGTYTVEGDAVRVRLVLRQDNRTVAQLPTLEGSAKDVKSLVDKMMAAIGAALKNLPPAT